MIAGPRPPATMLLMPNTRTERQDEIREIAVTAVVMLLGAFGAAIIVAVLCQHLLHIAPGSIDLLVKLFLALLAALVAFSVRRRAV